MLARKTATSVGVRGKRGSVVSLCTLCKFLWLLRYEPVAGFYVGKSEAWEKLADHRYDFVGHVCALRSSDKQRWLYEPRFPWVLEGEVTHVIEGSRQRPKRNTELPRLAPGGLIKVSKEKLSDWQRLQQQMGLVSIGALYTWGRGVRSALASS